jgi:apolipoprotein N-acyltransferase
LSPASFFSRLESLSGRKRYAAAFGLGSLTTLMLPPVGFAPILLASVPGLAVLARAAATKRQSFCAGWAFGAGYFIFGLYWVSASLFIDIRQWFWVMPFSGLLGPAVLGLFYGLIPLLAWRWRGEPAPHALALAAAWSGIEWLRGHVLTGFPWNLPGQAWDWVLPVMQVAAIVGAYGLTLLTLLWAVTPLTTGRLRLALIGSFIMVAAGGAWRLAENPTVQSGDYTVRIVQPNIPLTVKIDPKEDQNSVEAHLALTREKSALPSAPDFVIWPETALAADPGQIPGLAQAVGEALPPNALGIIGTLRADWSDKQHPKFYNSVSVLNHDGRVLAVYDKHHLVPFGEYMPGRALIDISPIAQAVSAIGDFTPGPGPRTLHIGTRPSFSPLICYEAIFPGETMDSTDRPAWLVNVTNDGWYLRSAGPHQHLAIARLRAIETGLPLARAADTGISAMFDPLGRELGKQPLETKGFIDTILPKPLEPTLYARMGDSSFFVLLALTMLGAEFLRLGTAKKGP